jgi:RND family efflux transporter MFP subunit
MANDDKLADDLASLRIDRNQRRTDPRFEPRSASTKRGERSGSSGWWRALGAVAVIAVLVAGAVLAREGRAHVFAAKVEVGAVTLVSPQQSEVTLVSTGYVYARRHATIAPKVQGRLAKLFVDEGAVVKKDQLIAELESADAQAQLAQVHADIAFARARVERTDADKKDAEVRSAREDDLMKRGAGTQSATDDARNHLRAAVAQSAAAVAEERASEARLQAAQVALENTKIRAPFDGTITRKLAEVGEVMAFSASGTPGILTIASLDDLEVQADVAETQFSRVKLGTPAEIILDAFPDRRFRGEVSEIRQMVDRAKASVTVKVKFLDDTRGVLPDMAAKVSFLTRKLEDKELTAKPKLVAPTDSVVERNGQKVVFTIADEHAHAIPVQVAGALGGDASLTELTSGPTTGTSVIRRPEPDLRDGMPVTENKK